MNRDDRFELDRFRRTMKESIRRYSGGDDPWMHDFVKEMVSNDVITYSWPEEASPDGQFSISIPLRGNDGHVHYDQLLERGSAAFVGKAREQIAAGNYWEAEDYLDYFQYPLDEAHYEETGRIPEASAVLSLREDIETGKNGPNPIGSPASLGNDRSDYDWTAYDENGFNGFGIHKDTGAEYGPDGRDRFGYDRDGYNRAGFNTRGIHRETGTEYAPNGRDRFGRDEEGYDREGYDWEGFDRDGYDMRGYNAWGYDRDGFDEAGWDRRGIHKETGTEYDPEGYSQWGYGKDGFNRDGKDADGFDRDGFGWFGLDRDGYDRDGYDTRGFNREGLHRNGSYYDEDGYDWDGYDRDGYDEEGYDEEGYQRLDKQLEDVGYQDGDEAYVGFTGDGRPVVIATTRHVGFLDGVGKTVSSVIGASRAALEAPKTGDIEVSGYTYMRNGKQVRVKSHKRKRNNKPRR